MRFLAIPFILLLTPMNGLAGPFFEDAPPGTYKTVTSKTLDGCRESCFGEKGCKGVYTLQPDITVEHYVCHLNDGLSQGSPFEILPPEPFDLDLAVADLNNYRRKHNLAPVTLDYKLVSASEVHAKDMAINGFVSHSGSNGSSHSDRMLDNGYVFSIAGENVASGQNSWKKVFKAWQDSPGHNENLLMPEATHFGISLEFEKNTQYHYYWAMIMAAPMKNNFDD